MTVTMRTAEAVPILKDAIGIPFGDLFKGHPQDLITNKGHVGQLLEKYVGLKNGNANIDFIDGELKTNKTKKNGAPDQTIAITQISKVIDSFLIDPPTPFSDTHLCKKLSNLLVVPVVKDGPCESWYLLEAYHIDLNKNCALKDQLQADYELICRGMRKLVVEGQNLKTTNGHYLQIRTKDSKPYHPIKSVVFGRPISHKNYAFYFQTRFINDVIKGIVVR